MSTSFRLTFTGPFGELFSWSPDGSMACPAEPHSRRLIGAMLETALAALRAEPVLTPLRSFAGCPLDEAGTTPAASAAQPREPAPSPLDRLREIALEKAHRQGWGFVLLDPPPRMIHRAPAVADRVASPFVMARASSLADAVPGSDATRLDRIRHEIDELEEYAALLAIPHRERATLGFAIMPRDGNVDDPAFAFGLRRPPGNHPCIVDVAHVQASNVLSFQRRVSKR